MTLDYSNDCVWLDDRYFHIPASAYYKENYE